LTAGTIQQTVAATGAVNEIQNKVLGTGGNLALTINAGSLKLSGQVGTSSTAVNVTGAVANGATLDFANASTSARNNITGTLTVNGTLKGTNANLGSANIVLNGGGKLALVGEHDTHVAGLNGNYYYLTSNPNTTTGITWGATPNLTRTDTYVDWSGANTHPADLANWPQTDHLGIWWTGDIYLATATTVKFGLNSDDGSVLLIDGTEAANFDGNHGFAGSPQYGASYSLAAGYYSLSLKYYEWEGGEGCHLYWDTGSGGVIIPASALFQGGLAGNGSYGNNMTVAAGSSTLDITDTVRLGIVTLNGGSTLSVTTPSTGKVSFSGTKLAGGSSAIATAIEIHLGALNDQSLTSTLTKTGSADLILDTAAVHGSNATIAVAGGRLVVVGSAAGGSPLGGAGVLLNTGNGGLVFASKSGDYTNTGAMAVNTSSTIEAKVISVGGLTDRTITLGGALTVASGQTATLGTADGYNLILAGPVTGNVAVAGGTVKLGANDRFADTSTLTISGGTFDIQTFNDTIGTLVLAGGTVAGDGVLSAGMFDLRSGMVSAVLGGGGTVTKTTGGTVTLTVPTTYASATTVSAGILAIQSGGTPGDTSAGTTVASSATLLLQNGATVTGETLTLNGAGPGNVGTLRGAGAINTWAGPITLAAASSIGTDSNALILSGPITGAFKLTKVGTGPLVLTGSGNNYTGGTDIAGGAVVAYNASSLGTGDVTFSAGTSLEVRAAGFNLSSGKVTVNTGATLDLYQSTAVPIKFSGGTIRSHGNITASGALADGVVSQFATSGGTLTFTAPLALSAARTWTVPTAGDTVTVSGAITGNKSLTKEGDGMLRLEGANSIASLTIGASGSGGYVVAKQASSAPVTVTINPGSAYSVEAVNHSYGEVDTMWSEGVIALARDSNAAFSFDDLYEDYPMGLSLGALVDSTYTGTLTPDSFLGTYTYKLGGGPGRLTMNMILANQGTPGDGTETDLQIGWPHGAGSNDPLPMGTVVLNAVNTLTGRVDVYGNLVLGPTHADALDTASHIYVQDGGSLDLNSTGFEASPTRMGKLSMILSGSIANTGGTLGAATLGALYPGAADYSLGGPGTGNTNVVDGALVNNSNVKNVVKVGTDQMTLVMPATPGSSLNTYSGTTTIYDGTLTVRDASSLSTSDAGPGPAIFVTNTGTLELANITFGKKLELLSSGSLRGTGTATANGVITVAAGATAQLQTGSTSTDVLTIGDGTNDLTGGDASTTLTVSGAGRVVLHNASDYAGHWIVSNSRLQLSANNALGTTGAVTVSGATAVLDLGASHTDTVGTVTLDGGGQITGTGTSTLSGTSYDVRSGTISAIVGQSGTAIMTKTTADTVTLSGANTYGGGTNINAGTLSVTNTGSTSGTGTGAVTVKPGATLAGTGRITGTVTTQTTGAGVANNGHIAPGVSATPATLTIANALTLANKTFLDYDLVSTGSCDMVETSGTLTFGTGLTLAGTPGGTLSTGTYHLIHYTGSLTDNSSSFSGWTVTGLPGGQTYSFSKAAPHYIDMILSALATVWNWNGSAGTDWHNGANWLAGSPPGATHTAIFDTGASNQLPTLTQAESALGLDFKTANWTIGGSGQVLTVGAGGISSVGTNAINANLTAVATQSWTVGADNTLSLGGTWNAGGATVTKEGAGALTVAGPQAHASAAGLIITDGTLNVNTDAGSASVYNLSLTAGNNSVVTFGSTQHLAALTLNNAVVATLTPGGAKTLVTQTLSIASATAKLDLTDNNLIVDYADGAGSPYAQIRDYIKVGRGTMDAFGAYLWNGRGITSSTAQADYLLNAIGILDNGFLAPGYKKGDLEGVPVDATVVMVKYTYYGDANLDGNGYASCCTSLSA